MGIEITGALCSVVRISSTPAKGTNWQGLAQLAGQKTGNRFCSLVNYATVPATGRGMREITLP